MQELKNTSDSEDLKSIIFVTNILFYRLSCEFMVLDTYDSNLEELLAKLRYVIFFWLIKRFPQNQFPSTKMKCTKS